MARKCCIPGCRSNYDQSKSKKQKNKANKNKENISITQHIPVFRFPSKESFKEEWQRWIHSIPRLDKTKIINVKDPVICNKHWADNFEKINVRGKYRPLHTHRFLKACQKVVYQPPSHQTELQRDRRLRSGQKKKMN